MNKLFSIFLALLTILFFSAEVTFARHYRYKLDKPEKRLAAKKCRDKYKKGKYKNEGKACIALKKNSERTGTCRKGYCRESK